MCALPAFAARSRARPGARIDVLASPFNAAVVEAETHVSGTVVYDARGGDRGPGGLFRAARRLRERRYDAVVAMRTATFANILAAGSGARIRVGYAGKPGSVLLTQRLAGGHASHLEHEVDRSARLVSALGAEVPHGDAAEHPCVSVTEGERVWAHHRMAELDVGDDAPVVGVHPGASSHDKRYPEVRFARAAAEVADALGGNARISVLEGPGDGLGANAIVAASPLPVVRPGPTTLRHTMALMARADVMLLNDSGPMHLAAALGTPLAAVFGPTDHRRWMPRQPAAILVRPDATRDGALSAEQGASNVRQIPTDWVVDAALTALKEGRNQ